MALATLLNPDDPLYAFEHMMQHREYFAVMSKLNNFNLLPYLLDPITDIDQPYWPWNQRHQQAHDDFNIDLPSTYEDGYTITVVTPAPATGTGNSAGTASLTLSAVSGTVAIGASIAGTGVPAGTTITAQQSGTTGGNGVYTTSQPTTLANIALTMQGPPYNQANTISHEFGIHQSGILREGPNNVPGNQSWWTFINHQQHFIANDAILPLPTTQPTTAGSGPGQANVSNPWWWAQRSPVKFPFW